MLIPCSYLSLVTEYQGYIGIHIGSFSSNIGSNYIHFKENYVQLLSYSLKFHELRAHLLYVLVKNQTEQNA